MQSCAYVIYPSCSSTMDIWNLHARINIFYASTLLASVCLLQVIFFVECDLVWCTAVTASRIARRNRHVNSLGHARAGSFQGSSLQNFGRILSIYTISYQHRRHRLEVKHSLLDNLVSRPSSCRIISAVSSQLQKYLGAGAAWCWQCVVQSSCVPIHRLPRSSPRAQSPRPCPATAFNLLRLCVEQNEPTQKLATRGVRKTAQQKDVMPPLPPEVSGKREQYWTSGMAFEEYGSCSDYILSGKDFPLPRRR